MKKFLIILCTSALLGACGNAETGDRTHDLQTPTETTLTPETNTMDTTPTTNNNAYNPDSAVGQGTTYDSTSGGKPQ